MANDKKEETPLPFNINIDDAGLRKEFDAAITQFVQNHCNPNAVNVVLNIKGKAYIRHGIKVKS